MRYRVEELAGRAGTSVDTVRFYQTRGLLPQPEREGRVVFYSDEHVERLVRIRELKDKGLTLKSIKGLLSGELDAADEALLALVDRPGDSAGEGPGPTLGQIARRNGVSEGLTLLGAGLPLSELLVLAREHDHAMRAVAERAVDVFIRFVRDPIRAQAGSEEEAAERLVEAFSTMLPATSKLVARHFEQVLLAVAQERIEN